MSKWLKSKFRDRYTRQQNWKLQNLIDIYKVLNGSLDHVHRLKESMIYKSLFLFKLIYELNIVTQSKACVCSLFIVIVKNKPCGIS